MPRPVKVPRPWVAMLLECPSHLHRAMKMAAAAERLTLQDTCFVAFETFLRRRQRPIEGEPPEGGEIAVAEKVEA